MLFTYQFLSSVTPSHSYPASLQYSYSEGLCEILIYMAKAIWKSYGIANLRRFQTCVWPLNIIVVGYQRDLKAYWNVVAKRPIKECLTLYVLVIAPPAAEVWNSHLILVYTYILQPRVGVV